MTFVLLWLVCSLHSAWAHAAAEEPLTLTRFLEQVEDANPALEASRQRALAQDQRVSPSGTLDDPFFAVGPDRIEFGQPLSSMVLYQLSQNVPFPGKLKARSVQAQAEADALHADAETLRLRLRVAAAQAYWRAFYNQQARRLNRRLRALLGDTIESTKARYKTGEATHHEWLLARAELAVLDVEDLRLSRNESTLFALMNELRAEPPQTPIALAEADFQEGTQAPPPIPILSGQPELQSLSAAIDAAESQLRLARLSYFPDFVAQGMLMAPGSEMSDEPSRWSLMVGVTLPLYFPWKQSGLRASAAHVREAALTERKALEYRLNTERLEADRQLRVATDVVALYQTEVLPATRLAAVNARSGYISRSVPLRDFLDVLRAEQTQELEFLAAKIDVELARTRLENLLSAPPLLRLAPQRPTLFGAGSMAMETTGSMGEMEGGAINLGGGVRGSSPGNRGSTSAGGAMGGMGGM